MSVYLPGDPRGEYHGKPRRIASRRYSEAVMTRSMLALFLLIAPALSAFAGEPAAPPPAPPAPTPEEIDAWIAKLGSDDWKAREEATEALVRVGAPALPALEKAARSDDPEVKTRALAALERIRQKAAPKPPGGREPGPRRRPEPFPGMAPWDREMAERLRKLLESLGEEDPAFPGWGQGRDDLRREIERLLGGLQGEDRGEGAEGVEVRQVIQSGNGKTVEISRDRTGKVSVVVRRKKEDGTVDESRFEAANLEEFQRKHPDIYKEYVEGRLAGRVPFIMIPGDREMEEWRKRMEEQLRRMREDPDLEKLRKESEERFREAEERWREARERFRRWQEGRPGGQEGIAGRVSIRVGDEWVDITRWAGGRIAVVVRSPGEGGKPEEKRYEAGSEEEFQQKFPEIYEKYLKGGKGGIRIQVRGPDVAVNRPDGLGVVPTEVTEILRVHLGIEEGVGFVVQEIRPGSPAERAGLQKWDLVLRAGGRNVSSPAEVWKAAEADGSTEIEIVRRGEKVTLKVAK
jgi:hypothetical protein